MHSNGLPSPNASVVSLILPMHIKYWYIISSKKSASDVTFMSSPETMQPALDTRARITIKLDRLIVLSESSLLGCFLHVSLTVIIKGRYPMEVSLIVIIKQVSA